MKKPTLFVLVMIMCLWGLSQTTSPEVISSSGDHFTGTTSQMSWTIGEIQTATLVNGQTTMTQGFHQPYLMVTALEDLKESLQVRVFPNPTTNFLNIEFGESTERIGLALIDASGKQLLVRENLSSFTSLDLSSFAAGTYFLRLTDKHAKSVKTFNIQKLN